MIIGIHPDLIGKESYSQKWTEVLQARGVEVRNLNLLSNDALKQASQCDGIMWRWAHNPNDKQSAQRILYAIEHVMRIPVFPNSKSSWHYDEKIAQYYLLGSLNAPTPATWLFWDQSTALNWIQNANFPLVFKLSSGAGSSNVIKVVNKLQAEQLIQNIFNHGTFPYTMNEYTKSMNLALSKRNIMEFKNRLDQAWNFVFKQLYPPPPSTYFWKPEFGYAYFQEFIPGNLFDTRVSIIGDRAFAFCRMNRPNDFRASGSGRIDYDPERINKLCIQIAFDISKRGDFQSMAYDFLIKEGNPVINEISYAYADFAVHECPGHWDAKMNWIEGHMWPEEAQAEDFINYIQTNF